jgi:DNA primase
VLLADSKPIVDLLWSRETEGQVLDSPERRAALDARLRAHLARIADPSLRGHWDREIRVRRAALFAPPPRPGSPAGARPARSPRGAPGRRGAAVPATPTSAARASLLATLSDATEAEARIRESAILAGCLNHPGVVPAVEERLEGLPFRCRDLGIIRDALLSAVSESLHHRHTRDSLGKAMHTRLGTDPLPGLLTIGHVRANRHLGPKADSEVALRAIDEEITRHAALAGRIEEIREAVDEIAGDADEALTARLRHAAEAGHEANTRPLAEHTDSDEAEHKDFVSFFADVEAQQAARRPRRR